MQKSKCNDGIPRRCLWDEMTPEEKAIQNIMWEVEKLPGSLKLTEVVIHLDHAKTALADHIEGIE